MIKRSKKEKCRDLYKSEEKSVKVRRIIIMTTTIIIIIIIIIVITVDDSNEPCKTGGKLEGQVNRSMHLLTL